MGFLDIFRSDSTKQDMFERSSSSSGIATKGNPDRDPLAAQTPSSPDKLGDQGLLDMYEGNLLARAMVDHLSEDMVRAGFEFESENDSLDASVNDKLGELDTQDKFQSMIEDDLIYGDGHIGIGLTENDLDISEEVEGQNIQSVDFLTGYDYEDITDYRLKRDLDGLSEMETQKDYKKIMAYQVEGLARDVHHDRMMHLQMRPEKDGNEGMSFFRDKQMLVKVFDNVLWSIGQALYQLSFKVIYTDLSEMSKEEVKKLRSRLETDLNVLSAFLLDKGGDDENQDKIEFPSLSQNISGLGDMIDFVEDIMSMGSKQPLSRLFGNQAGAVSGAEEDTRGYYDRIAGLQQSYLHSLLRKLSSYIVWANGTDPDSLDWDIKFNDLWEYDEQTEADIGLTTSKKFLNYWKMGAISGGEVAEKKGFEKIDKSLPDNFDLPEGEDAKD